MEQRDGTIEVFCCYAHEDKTFLNELKMHLSSLQRQNIISVWQYGDISAGTEWDQEIKEHLNRAQLILLLISPNFINSDYSYNTEMKHAFKRHEQKEARVISIIVRPTGDWENVPIGQSTLGALQVLPTGARAVTNWRNRDLAWEDVVKGIKKAINDELLMRVSAQNLLPQEALGSIEGLHPPAPVHRSELEQEKATIRIYTLGQFRLERRSSPSDTEWHTVTGSAWQHQRVQALLECLLAYPGRKLGRKQVMGYLWPDLEIEMAASRLGRSVYSLRQLFEPSRGKIATSPLLLTEREVLALADQPLVWVDADAFDHLLIQAHESNDPGEKEKMLEEAMLLYGGDFLPEAQKVEWTRPRRESLLRAWIGLLLELSDLRSERESYSASIEPLDKLLSVDPANEGAVQRLMLRLGILGRRGEALRAYRKLASILQQEYNISPLPDTRAIYEKVREGQLAFDDSSKPGPKVSLQPASQAVPRTDASATIQIGRSHQSPLIGRERELALLRDLVTTTEQAAKFKLPGAKKTSMLALDRQRRPQCILLMGEVGIGKTRLAEEISRDAKKRNWAVAWSRVYAQEGSIPYRLWTEVLRKAMEQGAWQHQEVSKRSLVFQPLSTLLPDILQPLLVSIAFSSALPPEQEQLRLWEAACELLKLISESTPLLIALDDLQWADASSCELLAYLSRRVQGYPIVIVGTCRENELAASHPLRSLLTDLQREHSVECISLEPLSDEQIDVLTSCSKVPQSLVKRIRSRAAGNPFFAEELAHTIALPEEVAENGIETQIIASGDSANGDGAYQLPETISAMLELRLSRLTPPCRRLLSKAAVLGDSFEFNIISAMEAMAPDYDEDIVLDLLEEAHKSGMLKEQGTGTHITYEFWHPLLVTHLYEKLSAARRGSLHRQAADILQQVYKDSEAVTITHHLIEGGANPPMVAYYAEMAGNQVYDSANYLEAKRYYQIALANREKISQQAANQREYEKQYIAPLLRRIEDCINFKSFNEKDEKGHLSAITITELNDSKEYYTCFISFSNQDQAFVEQLYADLQHKGVRCWYAPKDLKTGDFFWDRIDESIRSYDKLLLVLSQHSVESSWVRREVAAALEKEDHQKQSVLFPIRLDNIIMTTDKVWAADIRRQRHIGDFEHWADTEKYRTSFQRLLRALRGKPEQRKG